MKLKPKTASLACYGVAASLLALSLDHLSTGISEATGANEFQSIATAVGIDCALIALEVSDLASRHLVTFQSVRRICQSGIIMTLTLSAGLNIRGFLAGTSNTSGEIIAWILGAFVPLMVFMLVRVANAQQTSTRVPAKTKIKRCTKSNIRRLEVAR